MQPCRLTRASVPLARLGVERGAVLLCGVLVERSRVCLAHVVQPLAERVHDELVVAVPLLALVAAGARPRAVRLLRLAQQRLLVAGEEVELCPDEVAEAAAADHEVSSW